MFTPHLALPLIAASQAQKHVPVNEALQILDAVTHLAVLSASLMAPPAAPVEGDRYIVPAGASGAWSTQAGRIAIWRDGGWLFLEPAAGWLAMAGDRDALLHFDGAAWLAAIRSDQVGVNATPDALNRLSVTAQASLFNHEGGSHRLAINKAGPPDTASVLFQSGFSGRAEVGLTGSDALLVRTSADGSVWHDAIRIDPGTGAVSFPKSAYQSGGDNLLVNGHFGINQRGFAGGALAAGAYGFDRWRAGASGANLAVAGGVVTLTSGEIIQSIEPDLWGLGPLAGKTLCISAESPSANLLVQVGTAQAVIAAGSGRRSATLVVPSAITGIAALRLSRSGAGAVSFSLLRAELGNEATDWNPRPLSAELHLAQRYYIRFAGAFPVHANAQNSSSTQHAHLPLPVAMRATPTVTRTITSWGNLFLASPAQATATGISPGSIRLSIRANAAGDSFAVFDTIECNAELT
jgi:hypothetical protein